MVFACIDIYKCYKQLCGRKASWCKNDSIGGALSEVAWNGMLYCLRIIILFHVKHMRTVRIWGSTKWTQKWYRIKLSLLLNTSAASPNKSTILLALINTYVVALARYSYGYDSFETPSRMTIYAELIVEVLENGCTSMKLNPYLAPDVIRLCMMYTLLILIDWSLKYKSAVAIDISIYYLMFHVKH